MPAKFYTAAGISASFGIEEESGLNFLVDSYSYDVTSDKAEIFDQEGELVQTQRFNKKASITIGGYGNSAPEVGEIITTLVNEAGGQLDGTILIDQVVITKSSSDFERVEISATQYDAPLQLISGGS